MPSTHQSQDVDAPVEEVWKRFENFHDLSWAPDVVFDLEKVGAADGREPGAKRVLNHAFHETLVEVDPQQHRLRYSIDDGPSPVSKEEVSNYYGVVKLDPIDGGARTHVEWTSSWDASSEAAVQFCHGIYVALLDALAKSYQSK